MSKQSFRFIYNDSLYKTGQDVFDMQYSYLDAEVWRRVRGGGNARLPRREVQDRRVGVVQREVIPCAR